MKQKEFIQRIESHYVGDDCIQVMIPYINDLVISSDDRIIFYCKNNDYNYINNYMNDERRHQFPYSDIPIHTSLRYFFIKMTEVNQLLEFDKIYKLERDGHTFYCYVLKDNKEALLITSSESLKNSKVFKMKLEELKHLKVNKTNEPTIMRFLNNGFVNSEIKKAKKLVKTKKRGQ